MHVKITNGCLNEPARARKVTGFTVLTRSSQIARTIVISCSVVSWNVTS